MDTSSPNTTAYILCTTPRSGSTLLYRMLHATGVAGKPKSWFHRPSLEDWATRMQIPHNGMPETQWLKEIVDAAVLKGRADTDVFGLRLQGHALDFFFQKLALLFPESPTDLDRITCAFGPTKFIYLTRTDKVAQAVSLVKAEQSGLWHKNEDGSDLERSPGQEPETNKDGYDAKALSDAVKKLQSYDDAWRSWFALASVQPLTLTYETVARAPQRALKQVLGHIGLPPEAARNVTADTMKLSDKESEAWIARYRKEMGAA
ncbi:Stf0 family sulphotransferase [Shimia sp. NS0008-38b]|uniref:Stf0 family sulfotransferase n=1 Tax=Shimia sp. NS0008-38b TaxID=3127653 RepID=UPI0031039C4A